jgi:hypothetical protein
MDCRKFHRILEDYLEDGLDFSGRFGMERHAQQCIGCGKVLSNAQQLRRMARQLDRVKAPGSFEADVLREIGRREARGRFFGLRRFWLYGFDPPSIRRWALVASCLAVLVIGALRLLPELFDRTTPESPAASVPPESEKSNDKMVDHEVTDSDYLEFQVIGPDNQPVSFRWPNKYRVRYGQTPEEYFLRNVSH